MSKPYLTTWLHFLDSLYLVINDKRWTSCTCKGFSVKIIKTLFSFCHLRIILDVKISNFIRNLVVAWFGRKFIQHSVKNKLEKSEESFFGSFNLSRILNVLSSYFTFRCIFVCLTIGKLKLKVYITIFTS